MLRKRHRPAVGAVDVSRGSGNVHALGVLSEGAEKHRSDTATSVRRKHARRKEGALAVARAVAETAARQLSVQLCNEEQPVRRLPLTLQLDRTRRLVRQRDAANANPGFEVPVAFCSANLDCHPDLLSFPCFFA